MKTMELGAEDFGFIFKSDGQVGIMVGSNDASTPVESKIRGLCLKGMVSGDEMRERTSEIASITLGMLTNPVILAHVMMAIGSISDEADPSASRPTIN